jgi:predicted transcriptional regulator
MHTDCPPAGADLRARRAALGVTRQELAHEAPCSISYLGMLEQGIVPARSDVVPRVLAALDRLEASRPGDAP